MQKLAVMHQAGIKGDSDVSWSELSSCQHEDNVHMPLHHHAAITGLCVLQEGMQGYADAVCVVSVQAAQSIIMLDTEKPAIIPTVPARLGACLFSSVCHQMESLR